MKRISLVVVSLAAFAAFSAPVIPEVSNVHSSVGSKRLSVAYDLSADAIVTFDILTNGVSIGEENLTAVDAKGRSAVRGDAFRRVAKGTGKRFDWNFRIAWPDRRENAKIVVTAWPLTDKPPYMVVDISSDFAGEPQDRICYYATSNGVPGGITENFLYKTNAIVMKRVYARQRDYAGSLTNDFYLAVFETTQAQWQCIKGSSGVWFRFQKDGAGRPMDGATYCVMRLGKYHNSNYDVTTWNYPADPHPDSFLGLLRTRVGGLLDFDIPLKDQWAFAAYAGQTTGYWGDGSPVTTSGSQGAAQAVCPNLNRLGRYRSNGGYAAKSNSDNLGTNEVNNGTAIVGSYAPNDWGFYDMHGNVCERVHLPGGNAQTVMGGDCGDTAGSCWPVARRSDVGVTTYCYSYTQAAYTGLRLACRNGLK